MAVVSRGTKSIVLIKEEIEDDEGRIMYASGVHREAEQDLDEFEDEVDMETGMFGGVEQEEDAYIPDRDPLSLEDDLEEDIGVEVECLEELEANVVNLEEDDDIVVLDPPEDDVTPVITSVSSVIEELGVGLPRAKRQVAAYPSLDVFRCFLCRCDFTCFDDYLSHRTKSRKHASVPLDGETEKSFSCGICQKPWNQPRKALSCALFGHDPTQLLLSMFVHNCPICPDTAMGFHSLYSVTSHWSKSHPYNPIPQFLTSAENVPFPTIKISPQKSSSLTLPLALESPHLVLENFPTTVLSPSKLPSQPAKIFRCILCTKAFATRHDVRSHLCPKKQCWDCSDCGRRFDSEKLLRFHLFQGLNCHRAGTILSKADMPFKCFHCRDTFPTFKSFSSHRALAHRILYNVSLEKPFACGICMKPTFFKREAMICALFGHDPTMLRKLMFRFRCSYCTALGFHSMYAVKKHLAKEHPQIPMPPVLQAVQNDGPLPSVTVTIDQLKCLKGLWNVGSSLVIERDVKSQPLVAVATGQAVCSGSVAVKERIYEKVATAQPKPVQSQAGSSGSTEMANGDKFEYREILIKDSVANGACTVCGCKYKDYRRHMKVHDNSRFEGPPNHVCVCGRGYHLRNSLHSHWKMNKECKVKYFERNAGVRGNAAVKAASSTVPVRGNVGGTAALSTVPVGGNTGRKTAVSTVPVGGNTGRKTASATVPVGGNVGGIAALSTVPVGTSAIVPTTGGNFMVVRLESGADGKINQVPVGTLQLVQGAVAPQQSVVVPKVAEVKKENIPVIDLDGEAPPPPEMKKMVEGNPVDLYKQFEKLDAETPEIDESVIYGVDLANYKDLDVEVVPEEGQEPGITPASITLEKSSSGGEKHLPQPPLTPPGEDEVPFKRLRLQEEAKSSDMPKNSGNPPPPPLPELKSTSTEKHDASKQDKEEVIAEAPIPAESSSISNTENSVYRPGYYPIPTKSKKTYPCTHPNCGKVFPVASKLKDHLSIHTGERPFSCHVCNETFRTRSYLLAHHRHSHPEVKTGLNCYKCMICGEDNIRTRSEFMEHRVIHDSIFDKNLEAPFGCGVCLKPFHFRSQALICAVLNHDPIPLRVGMFQEKCPVCPKKAFGFHNFAGLRAHWAREHVNVPIPNKYLANPKNTYDLWPQIVIDPKKATKLRENGPIDKYDHELVIEFPLLGTGRSPVAVPTGVATPPCENLQPTPREESSEESEDEFEGEVEPEPIPIVIPAVSSDAESLDEYVDVIERKKKKTKKIVAAFPEITAEAAANAVKALVTPGNEGNSDELPPKLRKEGHPSQSKAKVPLPKASPREEVDADRALGNPRIARLLRNIRTKRTSMPAILQNTAAHRSQRKPIKKPKKFKNPFLIE